MKKVLIGVVLAGVVFSYANAGEADDAVAKAVAYLKGQSADPGITMALVAAGDPVDVEYLKSFSGASAIAYAKPILALTAAGQDPRTYPDENFVEKIKSFADSAQLGDASQLNDDIWGIVALISAGVEQSDSVVQNSKTFILDHQNSDGGWAWNVEGASDTNDTAATIMALMEAGISKNDSLIGKAISYLKSAQNTDGGFPYDPVSFYGTDSDANSDAWVIMAFNKVGEDTTEAVNHLLSLQDEGDGGFWWMAPPADFNNKAATADAVIALSGKSYPIAKLASPNSEIPEVLFRIEGSAATICTGEVKAETAMDVVKNAAEQCDYTHDIQETSFGPYLAAINNDRAEGLKGWLYRVNGELPNVGAADFELSDGESVLWYYGKFDDEPPVFGQVSDSVNLSVEVVEDGDSGGRGVPEVGFAVHPSELNFGQLKPGDEKGKEITVQNKGQKDLVIEAEIQGDNVFHFLRIEEILWSAFEKLLPAGAQEQVGIKLSVPSEFSSFGQKQGILILWGTLHE